MDANESDNPRPPKNHEESNDGSTRQSKDSHGRSRSHWGLSTAVHGVGFVAKKMVNNRVTDSLWSLKKSSSSSTANVPSDTSSVPDAKKENLFHETLSEETSKPAHERQKNKGKDVFDHLENSKPPDSENLKPGDGFDVSTTSSNVIDQSDDSKHQESSHVRPVNQHQLPNTISSNVIDHLGTSKPPNSSHARPVNQHRGPTTTSFNVNDHSETSKPPDGSHVKPATQHLWPSTIGSNVLSKNINPLEDVSKTSMTPDRRMLQESSSDLTTESQPSTPKKSHGLHSRGANPSPAPRGASLIPPSKDVRGVSLTPAIRGVSLTPATRGVSLTPKRVDPPSASSVDPLITRRVGPSLDTRGISPTPTTKGFNPNLVPLSRGSSPAPSTRSRGSSPAPSTRPANPLPEYHTPLQPSSPTHSVDLNSVPIYEELYLTQSRGVSSIPSRGASPIPSEGPTSRGVSPTPSRHSDLADIGRRVISKAKAVNPIPSKPSGSTRHFFSTGLLSMFASSKKEKIMTERKEATQNLELLQNVQVQWQFLNAGTEAAMDLQRIASEKSLFDMWRTILELRDSIAAKKIDITLSILQLKLYAVLYRQIAYIDEWASIEKEHESALTATVNDLVTRSILLPIIGEVKVKADIKLLKMIVCSSVEIMQTTISSIKSILAKAGGTRHLASELVNVALHERALLDECEIFLASAAPLQIEECSLMSYLIQLNRT